jgi:ribosomal protein S18 acetylase RimI-like enzyme
VSALEIAPLREDELRAGAALLARAFRENAMNRIVAPGSARSRERSNEAGMRAVLPAARTAGTVLAAREGGRLVGVLIALPPGVATVGRPRWRDALRILWVQGPGVAGRWSAVSEVLQLHRPLTAHAYLATLGVEPGRQRAGVGRALLTHWLAAIDARRERAYLETDSSPNVTWYERFGFAVRAELEVLGSSVYLMERRPRDA